MTDCKKLEHALIDANVSKRDLAKVLEISEQALFNKLKNITEFKASEIVKITNLLKLSGAERDAIFFNLQCDLKS